MIMMTIITMFASRGLINRTAFSISKVIIKRSVADVFLRIIATHAAACFSLIHCCDVNCSIVSACARIRRMASHVGALLQRARCNYLPAQQGDYPFYLLGQSGALFFRS